MNRRDWLAASAAATGSALTFGFRKARYSRDLRPARSRVAVLHADQYSDKLDELIYEGLQMFDLKIRGKSDRIFQFHPNPYDFQYTDP